MTITCFIRYEIDPFKLALLAERSAYLCLRYPCLDWSERKDHLAGPLATVLLAHFEAQGWVRHHRGERAIELTPKGLLPLGHLTKAPAA